MHTSETDLSEQTLPLVPKSS